jgi:hypothetical protein
MSNYNKVLEYRGKYETTAWFLRTVSVGVNSLQYDRREGERNSKFFVWELYWASPPINNGNC